MDKQFPIGSFTYNPESSSDEVDQWIHDIALLPDRIRMAIKGCSDDELLTPYREDGWNPREVISHLIDSHLNAIVRIKLALTEDKPEIRPYNQNEWVEVEQKFETPLEMNLDLLEIIHEKLVRMIDGFSEEDWKRMYVNPESGEFTLKKAVALYAWHSNHHLEHIRLVTEQK